MALDPNLPTLANPISQANVNAGISNTPINPQQQQGFLNNIQQNYLVTQGGANQTTDPNFVPTPAATTAAAVPLSTTNADGTPKTNRQMADETMASVTSIGANPTPPNLVELYKQLRGEKGITDLENSVTQLTSMQQDTAARLRERTYLERGKAVPLNVMQGRIGEIQTQEQENMAFIDRQLATKTMQLNSANNIVSTIMSLTGQDYANSSQWFNNEFQRRMTVHGAYETDANHDEVIAQSQLEIVGNMILDGSMVYSNSTPEQKLAWGKLEIAAGYAPGYLEGLKMKPGANIITTSSRTGPNGHLYTDIITREPDGSIKVTSVDQGAVYRASSGGGGGSSSSASATAATKAWNDKLASTRDIFYAGDIGGSSADQGTQGNNPDPDQLLSTAEQQWIMSNLISKFGAEDAEKLYNEVGKDYNHWGGF
jgi:hypothetical protein